jgi:hypothetical protein
VDFYYGDLLLPSRLVMEAAAAENQVISLAQILLRVSSGWVSIMAICCCHRD